MTCVITMSTPVSPEQLRWVLDHAESMAETIDVDATLHEIRVRMADLRLGEPARAVEVRDVVATAAPADDVAYQAPVDAVVDPFIWEPQEQACPDDPDGQHHVGCGCDDQDDDEPVEEPSLEGDVPEADPVDPTAPGQPVDADVELHGKRRSQHPHRSGSVGWSILEEVASDGGTFEGGQADVARALGLTVSSVNTTMRRLLDAGLVEQEKTGPRRTVAIRLTAAGWAHLGQAPPADDPEPAVPEPAAEVEDVPEPDEPPVDWSFMGRTDRADREAAAAAPKGNVLDAVEGPDDKGRPLIDSVEVVEELSDEELAAALGKAGGR